MNWKITCKFLLKSSNKLNFPYTRGIRGHSEHPESATGVTCTLERSRPSNCNNCDKLEQRTCWPARPSCARSSCARFPPSAHRRWVDPIRSDFRRRSPSCHRRGARCHTGRRRGTLAAAESAASTGSRRSFDLHARPAIPPVDHISKCQTPSKTQTDERTKRRRVSLSVHPSVSEDTRGRKSAPVFDSENRHGRKKLRGCCWCCNYAFI